MQMLQLQNALLRKNAELENAQSRMTKITIELARAKLRADTLEKCRQIILQVGKETQDELKSLIEHTVTLGLQSVYGLKYKFVVDFTYDKRDQLEVSFFIDKNGVLLEPRKDTVGYGLVDVCAFSLRMVMWMLARPQTSPIMVMDEPFKNASAGFISLISQMVKQVSNMLGIQFIVATHIEGMIAEADIIHQIGPEKGEENADYLHQSAGQGNSLT
jgi:hypothetical protein